MAVRVLGFMMASVTFMHFGCSSNPEVAGRAPDVVLTQEGGDAPAPPNVQLSGTVLLAEDQSVNQAVAAAMLRGLGLEYRVVDDGAEALAALTEQSFDAVLMDCQMPQLDGFEATRRIRRREAARAAPRMPIIALTANALAGDRERCLAAGMDDYLAKPFKQQDLAAVLQRLFYLTHL